MKRILALALGLALLLGLFPLAGAEQQKIVINLTRASFNLSEPDQEQVRRVQDAINAYIADKINVEVQITEIGSDHYREDVEQLLIEEKINLLWTASWESIISTNDLVSRGLVRDITNLLPGTSLHASLAEEHWNATRYNDRNYFIPVYKDNVEGYDFIFRKELVDKHNWNINAVHQLKDLEPMLAEAKADGIKYPFLTQRTAMFYRWYIDQFDFFTADAATNFFAVDRGTNQVINTLQTPEYAEFCKLMGSWAEKGYISPDDVNKVTTDTTTQSQDWAVSWWTDVPINSEASARYGQPIVVQSATERYTHSNSALGSCYCITYNSTNEQVKAAVDFMGLLFTDRHLADIFTFGIEGEDFEYSQTEDQMFPHVTQHSTKYNHSAWESAPAMIITPVDNEPDNKASLYVDFNVSAETSVASGFRFNKAPVEESYNACKELFDEYGFVLENGGIPAGEVDAKLMEYQAALDAAGYQEVLAEFQQQYENWKILEKR